MRIAPSLSYAPDNRRGPRVFGVFSSGCFAVSKAEAVLRNACEALIQSTGVVEEKLQQPTLGGSRVRRWLGHLWREWTVESWRPIAPAFAKPEPAKWNDARVTVAWIGHATVLINFFGIKILTDPVLFPRIGIRLPGLTIGPKRLAAPALEFQELSTINVVLLSHAHFDHFDLRTLNRFDENTSVITASNTRDLLRWTRLRDITELRWDERTTLKTTAGDIDIIAV